jgi:hypothetical protein
MDTSKKPNINYNPVADFLYLVIDEPTNAILASTKSYDAAWALRLFSSSIGVRCIETHKPWVDEDYKTINFNDVSKHYTAMFKSSNRYVADLNQELITPEFIERRRDVIRRLSYHDSLKIKIDILMASTGDSKVFLGYADTIGYELLKCKPEEGYYTYAVQAYGIASECNAETAYDELKLQLDNLAHVRMRSLGIYIKYRNRLNSSPSDKESQMAVIRDAMQELLKNSSI